MTRVYFALLAVIALTGCDVAGSPEDVSSTEQAIVMGGSTFVPVAGSVFQFAGNLDSSTQLYVAKVNGLAIGQTATAGSAAVQCAGAGGGYFVPCIRTREIGAWQCGQAVACGSSTTGQFQFSTPFTVGAQAHLDLGLIASAPTFIPTTAIITASDCTTTFVSPPPNFGDPIGNALVLQAKSQCATSFDYFATLNGGTPIPLGSGSPSLTFFPQVAGTWCITASSPAGSGTVCGTSF